MRRPPLCREDATERLLDAACMTENEWPGPLTRLKGWLTWRIIYAGNGEDMQPMRKLCPFVLCQQLAVSLCWQVHTAFT